MTRPAPTVTVPPQALEAIAFNLCSLHDFDPAFVRENERFAMAAITEYLRATPAPAAPQAAGVGEDELIERGLRTIRAYDAVRYLRDALSATTARLTGYDWNADPDGVTKQQGDAFSAADRVFADLDAAVAALPEIELPECQTCGGTGKIEEAARTEGANQHSACVRTCDDCDGCGFAPDDEPAPLRAPSREPEGGADAWRIRTKENLHGDGEPAGRWIVSNILSLSSDTAHWYEIQPLRVSEPSQADLGSMEAYGVRDTFATREEAPAEAGEDERLTPDEAWSDLLEKDDRTSPEDQPDMLLITRDELADYMARAQPQAREDAQPVWMGVDTAEDAPQEFKDWAVRFNATHPAPDALRETFEDIKSAADSFRDCEGDEVAEQVILRCDQALAALQAEQGAK